MSSVDQDRKKVAEDEQRTVEAAAAARREDAEWEPALPGKIARIAVMALLLAFVLASPHLIRNDLVQLVTQAGIFAIVALSMNILMGYAGQISLGHAAFYGIGSFISGVMVSQVLAPGGGEAAQPVVENGGLMAQIDPLFRFAAGLGMAGLAGAVAALLLGVVALRLRGLYLALVTIAYGALAEETLFKLPVFGGGAGIQAPRPPLFENDISYTYLVFAFVAVFLFLDWRLTSSRAGRAIQALRDDERVAASWGINVTNYKLLAFVLSGILAGVAGGLFAHRILAVNSTEFTLQLSLIFVLMTVVGGLGNRWGVIQGGIVFALLGRIFETAANFLESSGIEPSFQIPLTETSVRFGSTWEPMVGALLLILTLMFFPGGIAQQQEHLQRWLSFKRFLGPHGGHGSEHAEGGA